MKDRYPTSLARTSVLLRIVPIVLGLCGAIAALLLGIIAGHFMTWHYALGALSLASLAGGLLWLQGARWIDTLSSLVYTFFVIVCLLLVYLISANRYVRVDITRDKIHTLDPQTVEILARLPPDESITLQVFAPQQEHLQLQRFLSNYRREAPQIRAELYDPARDLDIVMQLGGRVENGDLIVTRQDAEGNILRRETTNLSTGSFNREHTLTNALVRAFHVQEGVIYYTTGHGERAMTEGEERSFSTILRLTSETALPVKPLRILQFPAIPADASALIIAGPTTDFFDQEREIVERYLSEGGKLFLLIEPAFRRDADFGNLEALLAFLGIESPNELVTDPISISASNSAYTPLVQFTRHPIAERADQSPFLLNQSRAFVPAEQVSSDLRQDVILMTHEQVWSEPVENLRSVRQAVPPDEASAIHERYMAVSVAKQTRGGRYGNSMRAVVIGDSDAFIDRHLPQNGGAASFFLSALGWLREEQTLVYVPPKVLTTTPVMLTARDFYLLMAGILALGLMITVGGTAWTLARRRMK